MSDEAVKVADAVQQLEVGVSFPVGAIEPVVHYMDMILPWGETGRAAEHRLYKCGYREAWQQRSRLIKQESRCTADEARFAALKEFPPEIFKCEDSVPKTLSERDTEFLRLCREGLNLNLRKRSSIDDLIAWVSTNIHRDIPDIHSAPSYDAINLIIDARTNEKVRARFWEICLSKRMSPGDKKGKAASVFAEDVEPESEGDVDELNRRLFGT